MHPVSSSVKNLCTTTWGKRDVRVIDVDDTAHAALVSMRRKRETGYRAPGYRRQRDLELF